MAVSSGEGARASDTNDVGDDVELETSVPQVGLPKRFARYRRDRHSSSCGPRAARHYTATQPHDCCTVTA